MDPDACLAEIREFLAKHPGGSRVEDGARLADLIEALDEWLTKGGFAPRAWEPEPAESMRRPVRSLHTWMFDSLETFVEAMEMTLYGINPARRNAGMQKLTALYDQVHPSVPTVSERMDEETHTERK